MPEVSRVDRIPLSGQIPEAPREPGHQQLRCLLEDSHRRLEEAAERNQALLQEIALLRNEVVEFRLETVRRARLIEREVEVEIAESADLVALLGAIVARRDAYAREIELTGNPNAVRLLHELASLAASLLAHIEGDPNKPALVDALG
jgi:hypothetical protein